MVLNSTDIPTSELASAKGAEESTRHLYAGGKTCSSCNNAAAYNASDQLGMNKEATAGYNRKLSRFPLDSGVDGKLRDISEKWHPVCVARRLRVFRRVLFSATKRAFWESILDATTTNTPLPQDEYEEPREIK